ncbi:MAG: penicillin-binding protein 1C [Deltaproteobacteria bacterium]|nr:penicillin-binding protein 1C [Deltaproteobacteria bacterium]
MLVISFFVFLPTIHFTKPVSAVIYARDHSLLSAHTATDEQWRFPARKTVPPRFAATLLSFEDQRFYWHFGIDPAAIVRALILNWRANRIVSGASTISMQVVRLWRENAPRNYLEKFIEMILAIHLEATNSKAEILALYAANAPFGGNVVGLDAAAWRYFGVAPERLSWSEAATLAVLPNSPALVHPGRNRSLLLTRRNKVLKILFENGVIDNETYQDAKIEPLPQRPHPLPQLAQHLRTRLLKQNGGQAYTTIDIELQKRVEAIVERHHQRLMSNHIQHAAAIVIDIMSGEILAYVGNVLDKTTFLQGGYVDAIVAPRSTGSILKPLLYAAAIDAGELLPYELLVDTPLRIGGFAPENFSRTFSGVVPAAVAIARSLNVPTARLLRDYGVDRFYALLKRLGMTTLKRSASQYGLSLILGGAEGKLWDIAGIYASLARAAVYAANGESINGKLFEPHVIATSITKVQKNLPFEPGAIYMMLQAMNEVIRPGDEASWREFMAPRKIAWKTGTSFGFRDAWAVGVTSRYAVGVWAGNVDGEGRPGLTGLSAAAPILFDIFNRLPKSAWFVPPSDDMVPITICKHSGQRAGPHCKDTEEILAPTASLQGNVCSYCQTVHLDEKKKYRVHGNCEIVYKIQKVERFVLPPVMEWFYRMYHADYVPLPPWRSDCKKIGIKSTKSLSIIYPRQDSVIYIPLEIDGNRGRAVFEATHREIDAKLYWHIDNHYLGSTKDIHQIEVLTSSGEHRLTIIDEDGESVERRFTVLSAKR